MFPTRKQSPTTLRIYDDLDPSNGHHERPNHEHEMALLALSHTPIEHQLYEAMLADTSATQTRTGLFSIRRLMMLTGLRSYSTIRRGRAGLVNKLSIENRQLKTEDDGNSVFYVFTRKKFSRGGVLRASRPTRRR